MKIEYGGFLLHQVLSETRCGDFGRVLSTQDGHNLLAVARFRNVPLAKVMHMFLISFLECRRVVVSKMGFSGKRCYLRECCNKTVSVGIHFNFGEKGFELF